VEELILSGDMVPKNCMDAKVYKDSICLLQTQIAEAQKLADKAQFELNDKRHALKEQLRLLENRAAILGQPINPHEMNQYTQAITAAENHIRHIEQTIAQHSKQLWHYVRNLRPIDAKHFKGQFIALSQAKLALMVQASKAEVDALV
jgi:ribosomal protein L29